MKVIKILTAFSVVICFIWLLIQPGFESLIALLSSAVSFITVFFIDYRNRNKPLKQKQKITNKSIGLQAGGDITTGNIGKD